MANKYFRQNFNKGGGADTGKAGERKSKTAVTVDKLKKRFKRAIGRPAQTAGIKGLFDRKPSPIKKKTSKSPMERQRKLDTLKSEAAKTGGKVMAADEMTKLKGESDKSFKQRMDKAFKAKKGGRANMMGGGMMGRRFGMKEGTPPPFVRREDGKPKKPPTIVQNCVLTKFAIQVDTITGY